MDPVDTVVVAGEIASPLASGAPTVTVVLPLTVPTVAVITALPAATPVTRPVLFTVATEVFELLQLAFALTSEVIPNAVSVADNWSVAPAVSVPLPAAMLMVLPEPPLCPAQPTTRELMPREPSNNIRRCKYRRSDFPFPMVESSLASSAVSSPSATDEEQTCLPALLLFEAVPKLHVDASHKSSSSCELGETGWEGGKKVDISGWVPSSCYFRAGNSPCKERHAVSQVLLALV